MPTHNKNLSFNSGRTARSVLFVFYLCLRRSLLICLVSFPTPTSYDIIQDENSSHSQKIAWRRNIGEERQPGPCFCRFFSLPHFCWPPIQSSNHIMITWTYTLFPSPSHLLFLLPASLFPDWCLIKAVYAPLLSSLFLRFFSRLELFSRKLPVSSSSSPGFSMCSKRRRKSAFLLTYHLVR